METIRLKQFKTVVDAGGLRKASDLLHISGGGLSKSLKTLEKELGVTLFTLSGRGLELTEAGRALYDRIPGILNAIDELNFLQLPKQKPKTLRIASFEVFTTYFMAEIANEIFSDFDLEVRESHPGRIETLIASKECEFGISYLPVPHAGVDFIKVGKIRMGIFGLHAAWLNIAFDDLPFATPIFPIAGVPSGVRGLDGWPDHKYSRQVCFRVEMMQTAIQLCLQGKAVAFLPEFVVRFVNKQIRMDYQLNEIALPLGMKPVFRDVYLIYARECLEDQVMRKLAKAIRSLG